MPGRTGGMCLLLTSCLIWGKPEEDKPSKSPVDRQARLDIHQLLIRGLRNSELGMLRPGELQKVQNLTEVLEALETSEPMSSARNMNDCGNPDCETRDQCEEPSEQCSDCKAVSYCNRECQGRLPLSGSCIFVVMTCLQLIEADWKGHKLQCFAYIE